MSSDGSVVLFAPVPPGQQPVLDSAALAAFRVRFTHAVSSRTVWHFHPEGERLYELLRQHRRPPRGIRRFIRRQKARSRGRA